MSRYPKIAAVAAVTAALVLSGCSSLNASSEDATATTDEFPGSQPITVIIPLSPGGSTDLMIRGLMGFVEDELGTKIIIENKVGAGGQVGLTELAGSKPDGYTIGTTNLPSTLAYINPNKQATYTKDSFQPLASVNRFRGLIAASSTGKWKTLDEMVAAAKAAPGSVTVGVDGLGGDDHIAVVAFEEAAGVKFKIVPFDDGSEKMTALIGNQIDLSFGAVPTFKAQLDTGSVIALAALDQEPIPGLTDVPTATSEGYDVFWEAYNVISAPAGISDEVLAVLEDAIAKGSAAALKDPTFSKQMEAGGYVFGHEDSAWATKTWNDLDAKWQDLVPRALAQN
ncbi:tripartite tricarboxylate transporter substrate binding protein [Diaminobutyricimonas sp. TR449]|uniref:Bug family tripartite tricarboxylate transporter substrate binding protein n=1 Tax=Diaminobutyricimonas sp. TR449 TaxID=2708076 RepID=UPI00142335DD|nr:tripartite tricarboxylate transporter substrate binding protein [Diaminobutyricimonas sp. TR449]